MGALFKDRDRDERERDDEAPLPGSRIRHEMGHEVVDTILGRFNRPMAKPEPKQFIIQVSGD